MHLFSFIAGFVLSLLILITPPAFSQTCTGSVGDPIINETFGAGTNPYGPPLGPGKTSSLNFQPENCPGDGNYAILSYTSGCWPSDVVWHTATDHTGNSNGYYMLINASYNPSDFYIQKVSGLCEGTTYQFAAWLLNMCSVTGTLPNITMTIEKTDGAVLAKYATGDVPIVNPVTWKQYGFNFTTPEGVSEVVLRMRNNAPGGVGNDVGLDDITFRPIGPAIGISTTAATGDTAVFAKAAPIQLVLHHLLKPVIYLQPTNGNKALTAVLPGAILQGLPALLIPQCLPLQAHICTGLQQHKPIILVMPPVVLHQNLL